MTQNIIVLLIASLGCIALVFAMTKELNEKIANGQKATSDLKYVLYRLLLQHKENKDEWD